MLILIPFLLLGHLQDVLPIAHKLGEKVMSNCTAKLKPYMRELVKSMGTSLSQYSKIVALICQESSDGMEQNDANASGMVMVCPSLLYFINKMHYLPVTLYTS